MGDEEILKEITKGLDRVKNKYGSIPFIVKIVDGREANIEGKKINIGREIPLELIEIIFLQEAYLGINGINQTEDFKEKDKYNNLLPYIRTKINMFIKIYEDFPELKQKANQGMNYILYGK